jgi:hypothetical protein
MSFFNIVFIDVFNIIEHWNIYSGVIKRVGFIHFYIAKYMPVLELLCSEHHNKKCKLHLPIELAVQYYRIGQCCIPFIFKLFTWLSCDVMQICSKICMQWEFVDTRASWFVWGLLNWTYVMFFFISPIWHVISNTTYFKSYRKNQQDGTVQQNLLFQCFLIAQHVSGDTTPIIRSSKTVIAASGFTYVFGCRPCWAIKKHWNNKFYYMVASCWFFL